MNGFFSNYMPRSEERQSKPNNHTRSKAMYVPLTPNSMGPKMFSHYPVAPSGSYFGRNRSYPVAFTNVHAAYDSHFGREMPFHKDRDGKTTFKKELSHGYAKKYIEELHKKNAEKPHIAMALSYLTRSLEALGVFHDCWKYTCWPLDRWNISKKDDEIQKKKNRLRHFQYMAYHGQELSSEQVNEMIEDRNELQKEYTRCSQYITDGTNEYSTYLRYFIEFVIISLYFSFFVMLIVYNQDSAFCQNNEDAYKVKPGCANINKSMQCQFQWAASTLRPYEYSLIRIFLFIASCIPYMFLYGCMEATKSKLLGMFLYVHPPKNPSDATIENDGQKKGEQGKSQTPVPANPKYDKSYQTYNNKKTIQYRVQKDKGICFTSPKAIEAAFFFLFFVFFFVFGIISLTLDAAAFRQLTNCNGESADWSLYLKMTPHAIPIILFTSNIFANAWGIMYMLSRICYIIKGIQAKDQIIFTEDEDKGNVNQIISRLEIGGGSGGERGGGGGGSGSSVSVAANGGGGGGSGGERGGGVGVGDGDGGDGGGGGNPTEA